MKMALSSLERKIIGAVQYGLPMTRSPYVDIAGKIGIPVNQLLETLGQWKAEGKIRRVGAIVNHFQMGHGAGAMVVWNVPQARTDEVGCLFASFPSVSHAYLRSSSKQWPYNLYTMTHASDGGDLETTIETMSRQSGIREFRVLNTVRELKKVPPTYILE